MLRSLDAQSYEALPRHTVPRHLNDATRIIFRRLTVLLKYVDQSMMDPTASVKHHIS